MTSPRDKVVDATLALAASRDFSEATLSDIAHRAGGVNRLAALFRMQERRRKEGGGETPSRN